MIHPTRSLYVTPMNIIEQNPSVEMDRDDLVGTPDYSLPSPFIIRPYAPGDMATWIEVQTAAERYLDINAEMYIENFGRDDDILADRQYFLTDQHGTAIGTASAWFDDDYHGEPYGRVHWVAIVPEYQGRGLAKPLLSTICDRLIELGHTRATLATSTARVPAINLYLHFGFLPRISKPEERDRWEQLCPHLKDPPALPWT